ncbi:deleted in malignant brain tumors 1 protein-like [Sceloporus undulatus]|uniref:deleted in malignant brain tumors 1 protein-like n=1 Tax=Sceloporus undulatus TaxID=8520 RepID=UPI001C4BE06A|nr:deleted in malignant brain tumors 1 protein-like [Sceloporus undulatus]
MSFSHCHLKPQEKHDCSHEDYASVICAETRLVNGTNHCSGRVEVLFNGEWGTVCDDGWNLADAQVVCRELGCGEALSALGGAYFGQGNGFIWLDDVKCLGTEAYLSQCNYVMTNPERTKKHDCRHEEDASVVCSDLRLVNGTSHCSGRVEVFHNNIWGTICDADWDLQDVKVVCRQLGCGKASKALKGTHYGQGSGPIWLESVNCTGDEATLKECQKTAWGEHSCSHSQDANVECSAVESVAFIETSIHLVVAGLVLLVLIAVVAEAGCSRRRKRTQQQL